MSPQLSPKVRRVSLALLLVAVTGLVSVCDQPSEVAVPDNLTPQMAPGGATTTVRFVVTREDAPATGVQGATVSVYFNNSQEDPMVPCDDLTPGTYANCWATTGASGIAEVEAPSGVGMGFLARVLPQEWTEAGNQVWPPAAPPTGGVSQENSDLGALTCGRTRPATATPGSLKLCFDNLYLTPRGTVEQVDLALPLVHSRTITVKDLEGNVISDNQVYAYLIEPLGFSFPWQNLPEQVDPGFLRFYGASSGPGVLLPKVKGNLEVYGKSAKGYQVAASQEVSADDELTVQALPVVCTNPDLSLGLYTFPSDRQLNPEFAFSKGKWVFGAVRQPQSENALDTDLKTTVVVLEVAQTTTATVTVSFSQRLRSAAGTNTASGTARCTLDGCTVESAVAPGSGSGNPMVPSLFYQASTGRLFWVVTGLNDDLGAVSEWSVKATVQSGKKTVVLDQWPTPSKSTSSSAFQVFADALKTTFCDPRPEWSYDGGWGCGI